MNCSYGKIPNLLTEISVGKTEISETKCSLSYEHIKNVTKDLEVRRDLGNWASPVNLACDRKYVCCSQASLGQEMKRTVNLKKRKFSLNDRFEGWFGPSVIFVHGFCS